MEDTRYRPSDIFRRRTGWALLVIAALSVIGCIGQRLVMDPTELDGSTVNLAGNQRMLSQRVALHVSTLCYAQLTTDERREREVALERDISDMRGSLASLAPSPDAPGLNDQLREHYFAEPSALSRRTADYLELAQAALEASREREAVAVDLVDKLMQHAAALIPRLHTAVSMLEAANREHVATLNSTFTSVLFVQMGMLWFMWSLVLRPTAEHLATRETAQLVENRERDQRAAEDSFVTKLQHGMENVDTEEDVMHLAQRAFGEIESAETIELLLADSSEAHLRREAASHPEAPGCSVETPFDCPAVRNGRTSTFGSSTALDACPRLAELTEARSALCVPVNFMGRSLGVLRAVGVEHAPPERRRLRVLGGLVGSRIGSIRAFTQVQLQAATDPLTGLLNRRAVEEQVHRLRQATRSFAVSMLDLDKFKALNDTHGHETGDRALSTFAKCMRETIGERGIIGRFGGEEFIVVLPGVNRREAVELLDGVRVRLAQVLAGGDIPTYTVSGGVSDTTLSRDFSELVSMADAALYLAKRTGRDRIVTHDDVVAKVPPVNLSCPPTVAAE